ncbi:hypothetical protein [Alteribacillus sp. HJP-4]|uniref:hypothetical protein n=1 Tax=Alteribacillus sp. HJP-4 TaxID=2775394 RepID=UPI0035CCD102
MRQLEGLRFVTYTLYALVYIGNIFAESEQITYLLGIIGMFALIISFHGANRTYQVLAVVFFIISTLLFFSWELPFKELPKYFTSMALLLALLYMIPYINHFMIVGRYERSLYRLLQTRTLTLRSFYRRVSFTHYMLGLFIFLSAIPLVYRFVTQRLHQFSDKTIQKFAVQSMLRSFASVNVWSPIEVYIALVLGITGVSYLGILPFLFGFSIFMLMIDWVIAGKYKRLPLPEEAPGRLFAKKEKLKLLSMGFFLLLFISTASLVTFLTPLDFFESLIIIIFPYTFSWAFIIRRHKTFLRYNAVMRQQQTKTMQNFMLLFIVLGCFNSIVEETNIFQIIRGPFMGLGDTPLLLFLMLQISSIALACAGVHPLVTISMQGLFVEPFLQQINPLSIAIVMITATLANDAAGTFNVPITMMSQYMKRQPYLLTLWNLPFALIFGGAGVGLAYLLL